MSSHQLIFSRDQARTMLLVAQGFDRLESNPVQSSDVLATIRQMGVLQIDTIHVVARSPYLVLWSRLGFYDPALLDELLTEGKLFEYWSHEACLIPIEAYPIYRRFMLNGSKKKGWFDWVAGRQEAADAMLAHVRERGPTRSSDFKRDDGRKGNWWNWKDEKVALDALHTTGDLMIAKRDKFHRIYDLRERVLPDWDDERAAVYDEGVSFLVAKTVHALGVAAVAWCADYFRLPKKEVLNHLMALESEGRILAAKIEGIDGTAYVSSVNLGLAESVLDDRVVLERSTLLSPFDPVVWDRRRALELFDFDYRIECYVPEEKRKFGYFVLPILVGNRIVGRLDAKAHRKERVFEVKNVYLEPGVEDSDQVVGEIADAIRHCAIWHQTPKVRVSKADRPCLKRRIQKMVSRSGTRPIGP